MDNTKKSLKNSLIKNSIFRNVMQARMVAMLVVMTLLSATAFSSTASAGSIQDFFNAASASAANFLDLLAATPAQLKRALLMSLALILQQHLL